MINLAIDRQLICQLADRIDHRVISIPNPMKLNNYSYSLLIAGNFFLALLLTTPIASFGQGVTLSNPEAAAILAGNYDPAVYTPSEIINTPDSILYGIVNGISKDSLLSYLMHIDSYYQRNTGSDTISSNHGIGAVRRWIYSKFGEFSSSSENRLVVTYEDFDAYVCGKGHHRNVMAVLPGLDTTQHEILIVEGHYDTRCEGACDTTCYSPGMEDNGSGTVLVMELARVMSRFAFNHTIVFANVTGEDQGLYGARALARYVFENNVPVMAVFNNDVIGGIICGATSSAPSCPYMDNIDSTHVRIFSYSQANDSSVNSIHKQLVRYIKLHQEENINPLLETPMTINMMIREDRVGRSGDQIPFREKGYRAIRFCSQNEHGDGTGTPPDRQHSVRDVLGLDLSDPPDGVLDTFFVDMGYLRRNAISNGVNLGYLAISPPQPQPEFNPLPDGVEINMTGNDTIYKHYRVGIRSGGSGTLYFDTVTSFSDSTHYIMNGLEPGKEYYFSVMNVANGVESMISDEYTVVTVGMNEIIKQNWGIWMDQNYPNPFSGETEIRINVDSPVKINDAGLLLRDPEGHTLQLIPFNPVAGENIVKIKPPAGYRGMIFTSLIVQGNVVQTSKMVVL